MTVLLQQLLWCRAEPHTLLMLLPVSLGHLSAFQHGALLMLCPLLTLMGMPICGRQQLFA